MIDKIKKDLCTGCNSCYNACSENAITMETDEEGFWYPFVDKKRCTSCGICLLKCPSLKPYHLHDYIDKPEVFAGWSKDEAIRHQSTSGGIFSELAQVISKDKGYIAGAKYTSDFMVEHSLIDGKAEIEKLRQSKYVQSQIGSIFKKIKNLLEQGKQVLFCGTPCQNAGLSIFLGKEYQSLIKVDFICRGIISPMVYKKYLDMLEVEFRGEISKVAFKNKTHGWNGFSTLIEFKNGEKYLKDRNTDLYMVGYLRHNLYLRPCCHKCLYKELPRKSDITLGDFWGIGKTRPLLDDNKGTSVIMINTNKGRELFEKIKDNIQHERCTIEEVASGNGCLYHSVEAGKCRDKFFEHIKDESFNQALKSSSL